MKLCVICFAMMIIFLASCSSSGDSGVDLPKDKGGAIAWERLLGTALKVQPAKSWTPILRRDQNVADQFFLHGDRCFLVSVDHSVLVYDLKTGKQIGSWGRKGQGPGEFPANWPVLDVSPAGRFWAVLAGNKVVLWDGDGHLWGEKRLPNGIGRPVLFAEGFLGVDY